MNDFLKIIEGCQQGNRDAQMKVYDKFSPVLFVICLRYCVTREDAEDVLQESYIRVFKNINQYEHKGSFEGWLKRITVNTALSHLRKKHNLSENLSDNDETNQSGVFVDTTYSDNLELNDLLKMINQLTPQRKAIFNLYEIEGFSHKEIGEMLGISEGGSRSQLAKAKGRLKEIHTQMNQYDNEKVS